MPPETASSATSDLTYSDLPPVVSVQAKDFGSPDLESQPVYATPLEEQELNKAEAQNQSPQVAPRWTRLRVGLVIFSVVALAGIVAGVVLGTRKDDDNWFQPSKPRRALVFSDSFSSCTALREAFGEATDEASSAGDNWNGPVYVEPGFRWWPDYPQDYCDFCTCANGWEPPYWLHYDDMMAVPEAAAADADGGGANGGESTTQSADEFTGTNNQVEEVDESDIIKTDGTHVYILPRNEKILVIATAYPFDTVSVVSTTNLTRYNLQPSEMLLDGDSLVIIGSAMVKNESAGIGGVSLVSVQLWDISSRSAPQFVKAQEVEGSFNTARLIDGQAYAVIQTWPYSYYWYWPMAAGVPSDAAVSSEVAYQQQVMTRMAPLARVLVGEEGDIEGESRVPLTPITECSRISSVEGLGAADSWLTIVSMATSGESRGDVQTTTHAGRGGNVFVSTDNIYIAATNYDYFSPANRDVTGQLPRDGVWTAVLKFGIAAGQVTFKHLVEVPGSVLNQFSMDEHEGFFRIATTYGEMWSGDSVSNVFIFDADGHAQGSVTGLAPGERIFSARFQGDTGYIVTFRQVDPLFVIDLSTPSAPRVLGELKIPGWSDYLHPVDGKHLLGLGKAATDEGVVQGVKVALFDVSDPTNPTEKYSMVLGDRGTESEATHDHKAFLFHQPTNLLVFPLTLREVAHKDGMSEEERQWAYGELAMDGAVVLYLGESGFEHRGYVSHMPVPPASDHWWHGVRSVYRATYMAGGGTEALFSYSQRELRVHDLADLAQLSQVPISQPQCVADSA